MKFLSIFPKERIASKIRHLKLLWRANNELRLMPPPTRTDLDRQHGAPPSLLSIHGTGVRTGRL